MKQVFEVNFDGLVGPTHNYAGLAFGNIASSKHAFTVSNPKSAALQGLEKMRALMQMGLKQAVIPPHARPDLKLLHEVGFRGDLSKVLKQAKEQAPNIFAAAFSAASMWTANAATVTPSIDTLDCRLHITPANLISGLHRSIEAKQNFKILSAIFSEQNHFYVHNPLPNALHLRDEGAANYVRLTKSHGEIGKTIFVYGEQAYNSNNIKPKRFPARQTLEAFSAIARLHQLNPDNVIYVQQNPDVIDQGVFHNDVISVGNERVLFYHQEAFVNTSEFIDQLQEKLGAWFLPICVPSETVSVKDAVSSYLFNSQLITLPNSNEMLLNAPSECEQNDAVHSYLNHLISANDNPINKVIYTNCKQSMQNGGGPACLRLRILMTEEELAACHQGVMLTDELYEALKNWINTHYRDELSLDDLSDPKFVMSAQTALDELTKILGLPDIY